MADGFCSQQPAVRELRICNLHGHVCKISADESWRVVEVKEAIEIATQTCRWQQNLLWGTRRLSDDLRLGELELSGPCGPCWAKEDTREDSVLELTLVVHSSEKANWLRAAHEEWSDLLHPGGDGHANAAAWADRDVVLAAIQSCGWALKYAAADLRADHEVVHAAVRRNGLTLQYAAPQVQEDWDVALAAVEQCGRALDFVAESLRSDREFILAAVSLNGRALRHASENFRSDRELALAAVRQRGSALHAASPALRGDYSLVLEALQREGSALAFAAAHLRADPELQALAKLGEALPDTDTAGIPSSASATGSHSASRSTRALQEKAKAELAPEAALQAQEQVNAQAKVPQAQAQGKGAQELHGEATEAEAESSRALACSFGGQGSEGHLGLKRTLGASGALLCEMAKLGLPVLPGFCLATPGEQMRKLQQGCRAAAELSDLVKERLAGLEEAAGCRFGDPENPLLLSVSGESCGAAMVGLNDLIVETWEQQGMVSSREAWDAYRCHLVAFAREVRGLDMRPFEEQLRATLQQLDERCQLRRKHHESEIPAAELRQLVAAHKLLYEQQGCSFPQDPTTQLWEALAFALSSSSTSSPPGTAAASSLATATVQAMACGPLTVPSASGILRTDSGGGGGELRLRGDWAHLSQRAALLGQMEGQAQAQVQVLRKLSRRAAEEWAEEAGVAHQERLSSFLSLEEEMPGVYADLMVCQDALSCHLKTEAPAVEFVVQRGLLWLVRGAPLAKKERPEAGGNSIIAFPSLGDSEALGKAERLTEQIQEAASRAVPGGHGCDAGTGPGDNSNSILEVRCAAMAWACVWARAKTTAVRVRGAPGGPGTFVAAAAAVARSWTPDVQSSGWRWPATMTPTATCCSWNPTTIAPGNESCAAGEVEGEGEQGRMHQKTATAASVLRLPLWQTMLAGGLAGAASRWVANAAGRVLEGRGLALLAGSFVGCGRALPTGAVCTTAYFNLLSKASADSNPDGAAPVARLGCAVAAATFANTITYCSTISNWGGSCRRNLHRGLGASLAASVPAVSLELCAIDLVRKASVDAGLEISPALLAATGAAGHVLAQVPLQSVQALRTAMGDCQVARHPGRPVLSWKLSSLGSMLRPSCSGGLPAAAVNSLLRVGLLTDFMRQST